MCTHICGNPQTSWCLISDLRPSKVSKISQSSTETDTSPAVPVSYRSTLNQAKHDRGARSWEMPEIAPQMVQTVRQVAIQTYGSYFTRTYHGGQLKLRWMPGLWGRSCVLACLLERAGSPWSG